MVPSQELIRNDVFGVCNISIFCSVMCHTAEKKDLRNSLERFTVLKVAPRASLKTAFQRIPRTAMCEGNLPPIW